jgi:hypothetical protein
MQLAIQSQPHFGASPEPQLEIPLSELRIDTDGDPSSLGLCLSGVEDVLCGRGVEVLRSERSASDGKPIRYLRQKDSQVGATAGKPIKAKGFPGAGLHGLHARSVSRSTGDRFSHP